MSFDSLYGMFSNADGNPGGTASSALVQESQEIQRALGTSSPATRDVSGARQALDAMRALPAGDAQAVWNQLDQHQQQQLEMELLKEKGAWHKSSEDAAGDVTNKTQDQFTTAAQARNLHPTNQAEKIVNHGLQQDIYRFTENNSLSGSPYANAPGTNEKIFQSHANAVITSLNESEKQHEFNGNTHSEQQYRHPSLVITGGPLFDGGRILQP